MSTKSRINIISPGEGNHLHDDPNTPKPDCFPCVHFSTGTDKGCGMGRENFPWEQCMSFIRDPGANDCL